PRLLPRRRTAARPGRPPPPRGGRHRAGAAAGDERGRRAGRGRRGDQGRPVDRVLAGGADRGGARGGRAGGVPAAGVLARRVAAAGRLRRAAGDGGGRVDAARPAPADDLGRGRDGGDPVTQPGWEELTSTALVGTARRPYGGDLLAAAAVETVRRRAGRRPAPREAGEPAPEEEQTPLGRPAA